MQDVAGCTQFACDRDGRGFVTAEVVVDVEDEVSLLGLSPKAWATKRRVAVDRRRKRLGVFELGMVLAVGQRGRRRCFVFSLVDCNFIS